MGIIKFGCQTYPWKLHQEQFSGQVERFTRVTASAGFSGLEAEIVMLGDRFRDDPKLLKMVLDEKGLELAALVLHLDWHNQTESKEERAEADRVLRFLRWFPDTRLMLSHHAVPGDRSHVPQVLAKRRHSLISCMGAIAERAADQGIITVFHPNSSVNSLFRIREDYSVMFEMLAESTVGWAPDIGHIANGGMEPIEILKAGRPLIRHIHFKDYAGPGQFVLMGKGIIDYAEIVTYLRETDYSGWIIVEDESPEGDTDPDDAVFMNGMYMQQFESSQRLERNNL